MRDELRAPDDYLLRALSESRSYLLKTKHEVRSMKKEKTEGRTLPWSRDISFVKRKENMKRGMGVWITHKSKRNKVAFRREQGGNMAELEGVYSVEEDDRQVY